MLYFGGKGTEKEGFHRIIFLGLQPIFGGEEEVLLIAIFYFL